MRWRKGQGRSVFVVVTEAGRRLHVAAMYESGPQSWSHKAMCGASGRPALVDTTRRAVCRNCLRAMTAGGLR